MGIKKHASVSTDYKKNAVSVRCVKDSTTIVKPKTDALPVKKDVMVDRRDGKNYETVQIGIQVWMAENLAYTALPSSYCCNDTALYCVNSNECNDRFGVYYTWNSAKNACPAEWHLPGKEEFETLLATVGGTKEDMYNSLTKGGGSGFDVVLGSGWGSTVHGMQDSAIVKRVDAGFWTSTEKNDHTSYSILFSESKHMEMTAEKKEDVFTVRCIKDSAP